MRTLRNNGAVFVLCALAFASCATVRGGKDLDPASREFLSRVRYIITSEERKTFQDLAPAERPAFVEEFWKARDPNPATEANEYRDEYFRRIKEANVLFKQGSTPGWLQDRGRVYIILGPPDNRETYPRGRTFYGQPEELWWYGFFPILFYDDNWTGYYKMDPLSAQQIVEIARAQTDGGAIAARKALEKQVALDFELKAGTETGRAVFKLEIPYRNIWLDTKGDDFQTTLDVVMEVTGPGSSGEKIWEHRRGYEITLSKPDLAGLIDKLYVIDVQAELGPGDYILKAEIANQTGGAKTAKNIPFSLQETEIRFPDLPE